MFRLEEVSKTYTRSEGPVEALRSASFEIRSGEFVAIVGPSGSGKSTLLTILGGMLTPTAGKVWLEGRSLYDLSMTERAEIVGGHLTAGPSATGWRVRVVLPGAPERAGRS